MKTCTVCSIEKDNSEFHKRTLSSGTVSLSHLCKMCAKEKNKKRYQLKKEHINSINKEWRYKNKDYYHARYQNNKELYLSWLKEWSLRNPAAAKQRSRQRRIRSKHAFVNWANKDSINAIYAMSKFLTSVVGVQYHVDHIIPLQGKLVSGLHVENNLSIVRADYNLSKGNKYESG